MKLLIILTILLSSFSVSAFEGPKTHKGYAKWFEKIARTKIYDSFLECTDKDGTGYYSCVLTRTGDGMKHDAEYRFLQYHLDDLNKNVGASYNLPKLNITRSEGGRI